MLKTLARWLFGPKQHQPASSEPITVSVPPPVGLEATGHTAPELDTVMEDLRAIIDREVVGGFTPPDQIAQFAVDCQAGLADEAMLTREAERLTREALAAHQAAQVDWPAVTDCDKLDAAFASLEALGVVSRQNFTCCGTCGSSEIWDEIDTARNEGRSPRGYAFFHQQDTESAAEGYGLYLNYGACEEGSEAAVAIGHEIVEAFNAQGLATDWDGRIERRIAVSLDWKRRATAGASSQAIH